jgi:hypothetical protein
MKIDMFKDKDLEIYDNGIQFQREELTLKHTF